MNRVIYTISVDRTGGGGVVGLGHELRSFDSDIIILFGTLVCFPKPPSLTST